MKSILFHQHGGIEVLKYSELPTPDPNLGQVQIRLRAAALNRLDLWVRNGWPGIKLDYPHIPGADGAGEIVELGEGVSGWEIGDHVSINSNIGCGNCEFCKSGKDNLCQNWQLLGETINGTYCEYINVSPRQLFRIPDNFSYHIAAAAGLTYHTAWHSLIVKGEVNSSDIVVIVGASGGVNTASIVIAKYKGAKVIVIGSNKNKLLLAESLGADILIDRGKENDWAKSVYKVTNKRGADIIVDNIGSTFPLSLRAVRKGGKILTVGNTGGPMVEIDNRYIFGKHISILGSTMGTLQDYKSVMSLVASGQLIVAVDKTYSLKDAAFAQERLENGEQYGKITLEI